ncbi:MAG: hypothetical protein ACFFAN_16635 [Promethearchaeota archaeon]
MEKENIKRTNIIFCVIIIFGMQIHLIGFISRILILNIIMRGLEKKELPLLFEYIIWQTVESVGMVIWVSTLIITIIFNIFEKAVTIYS